MFVLIMPLTGYAAGLNASEQELVAKAKGTFEWNGKQYRAKQTYIDQLTAYLSREDIDFGADTCAAAAQEMYGNVERGVTEGYLYEVDSDENQPGENQVGENQPGENQSGGEPVTEAEAASQKITDTKPEKPLEEPPEYEESTSAMFQVPRSVLPDKSWHHENETDIGQTGTPPNFEAGSWLSMLNPFFYRFLMIAEAFIVVFLLTALAVTARSRGLRHRRKARKGMQIAAVFMTAAACFLSGVYITLRMSVFSDQAVMNQIEKTSWYQTVYDDMKLEAVMTMSLARVPDLDFESKVKYSNVVLAARQYMQAALEGSSQPPALSGILGDYRTSVMEYFEKTYQDSETVETGVQNLLAGLEDRCGKLVRWAGMDWWRGKTQDYFLWFPALLGGVVLAFVLGAAELICLSRSGYRAVKRIGYSLAGGFISLVITSLLLWRFDVNGAVWEGPYYMKEFVWNLSVSAAYSALIIGGIGCCIAVMAFYISKCMKFER
ncbi:MAG: hypothetical protein LUG90_00210 [Clostridiaceae bacterium]|nr:hypothetical protein [Clostridiaceae bacterium]